MQQYDYRNLLCVRTIIKRSHSEGSNHPFRCCGFGCIAIRITIKRATTKIAATIKIPHDATQWYFSLPPAELLRLLVHKKRLCSWRGTSLRTTAFEQPQAVKKSTQKKRHPDVRRGIVSLASLGEGKTRR